MNLVIEPKLHKCVVSLQEVSSSYINSWFGVYSVHSLVKLHSVTNVVLPPKKVESNDTSGGLRNDSGGYAE